MQQLYRNQSKANSHNRSHRDSNYDYSPTLMSCDRSGNHADHNHVVTSEHQIDKNDLQ